jgi:hypothetical protein
LGGTYKDEKTMMINGLNGQINGALKLSPSLQNLIVCESNKLKINARDRFIRRCAEMLRAVIQPPSRNDVIMVTRAILRDIPTRDVLIHGDPTGDEDIYDQRY